MNKCKKCKKCKKIVHSNIKYKTIDINGTTRYYATINMHLPTKKILLCFPGGGEDIQTFLDYTSFNLLNERIIVFQGQVSGNGYTFQSSFPWLFNEYQNDVSFVDKVLTMCKFDTLFLTGKSEDSLYCIRMRQNIKIK